MRYVKEISGLGMSRFAAIQEDQDYEVSVSIHETGKVAKIQLAVRPTVDTRPECTAEEFTEAYIKGLDRFALFMLSLTEVPTFPTCHKCGTMFLSQTEYFQKCTVCNISNN